MAFDGDDPERPLRIWDFVDGDLVERDPGLPDFRHSRVLGGYWVVKPAPELGLTLRLARDAGGAELFPTPEERIRELEAELCSPFEVKSV